MFGRSRRTAVLPAAAVLLALCPAMSARAASAVAPSGVMAIGDRFTSSVRYNPEFESLYPRPGPAVGVPTIAVDSVAHTVDLTVQDRDQISTITLPWPLQTGISAVGRSASPSVAVRVTRNWTIGQNTSQCDLFTGSLNVLRAEMAPDGGVAALSADLSWGSCDGGARWSPAAQIRIGGGSLDAVPVAEPEQLDIGPLGGTPITLPVTVSNAGTKPWHVRDFAIGDFWGINAPTVFTIVDGSNTCVGATLDPGGQCTLTLTAASPANFVSEWLVVAGDGAADLVVPLRVEGHDPIPAPTGVVVAPGRHASRVSWDAPATDPYDGFRVYDVTGGARTLVGKAIKTARFVDVTVTGPRDLVVVAADSRKAESPDTPVTVPAVDADVVAQGPAAGATAFGVAALGSVGPGRPMSWSIHLDLPGGAYDLTGSENVRLDPAHTTWLTWKSGYGIYLCHDDGTRCTTIPLNADVLDVWDAAWLLDGRVAFVAGVRGDDRARGLWVVGTDGSGLREVMSAADGAGWRALAASPTGDAVYMGTWDHLLRIQLSDGRQTIVPGADDVDWFTLRTDGRLVLVRRVDLTQAYGPTRVTIQNPDGTNAVGLPLPAGTNRAVTFSPDGARIAFLHNTDQLSADVWVANADGSQAHPISDRPGNWTAPVWAVDDLASPTVALAGPTVSAATASLNVTAHDVDDPVGSLHRECRLDTGAWTQCGSTWTLTGLAAGTHTAAARVTDAGGLVSSTVARSWTVDRSAPTATLAKIAKHAGTKLALHWIGQDTGVAGVASYEIRQRSAGTGKHWGGWHTTVVRSSSLRVKLKAKHRYEFEVRATDAVGNVGPWSGPRTTTVR